MVEYWRQRADAEATADEAQRLHESRGCSAATTLDGMVDVRALLDPIGGASFLNELERLQRLLDLQDKQAGTIRTVRQRRADALAEMAARSRTAHEGGLRPRPLITVLVGEATLEHLCQLACGTVIAPGLIVPLLSTADIERVVFDGPDRVIGVSRKRRFTGALRRAIEVRDRHCRHPSGCDEPADTCDVDHITPHSQGGPTSQDNGTLECRPHNRDATKHNAKPKTTTTTTTTRRPPPTDIRPRRRPTRRAATTRSVLSRHVKCRATRATRKLGGGRFEPQELEETRRLDPTFHQDQFSSLPAWLTRSSKPRRNPHTTAVRSSPRSSSESPRR